MFKPHTFDDDMDLSSTVHQKIYDSTYIGYGTGNDMYLLTKAQNDNQRAVFNKADCKPKFMFGLLVV